MYSNTLFSPFWVFAYGFLIVAVVIGGYFVFVKTDALDVEIALVEKKDLIDIVQVIGTVVPFEQVKLGFERSGRVTATFASVGDVVFKGKILANLDDREARAKINQARANLEAAVATLTNLERGTRQEEIIVQEIKVANSRTALKDAEQNLLDTIHNSFTSTEDIVRDDVDQLFTSLNSNNPKIIFLTDSRSQTNIELSRLNMQTVLSSWQMSLNNAYILGNTADLVLRAQDARSNLGKTITLLTLTNKALNNAIANATAPQSTLDTWTGEIGTGRGVIDSAVLALSTSQGKLNTAFSSVTLEEEELTLLLAGATKEEIDVQRATVRSKEAAIELLEAELEKSVIRSPMRGVVTEKGVEIGELVTASAELFTIISESSFEIEANIPEADIAKVKVGNRADITLDAYGDEIFFGVHVVDVEPAETVIEGVATYKTTFRFDEEQENLKSGMTANLDITVEIRVNVLTVPGRAVLFRDGIKTVRIVSGGKISEVEVTTGIRSYDGSMEILTGLSEGDVVVTSTTR